MTTRTFLGICLAAMMGCAAGTSTASSSSTTSGGEATTSSVSRNGGESASLIDVGKYRPVFPDNSSSSAAMAPVVPTNHIRNQVMTLMDSVAQANKNIKYAAGYRILAYTGNERKTAMDLRNNIIGRLPSEKDYLTFKQPTYQLKVGDYFTRIEAQTALNKIIDLLPNALIVAETINIPKSYPE